jgi:hypothetical protein
MIDRNARNLAAQIIRHYVCGVITNKEFEGRYPSSKGDPIIRTLEDSLWASYEDIGTHKLTGKNAVSYDLKQRIARWLLFLYSDCEYRWPEISDAGFRDLPADSWFGNFIRTIFGYEERSSAFLRCGDYDVWPFLAREEYENAIQNPILLNGTIQQALGADSP